MTVGTTYETLSGERYVYMGKYNTYGEKVNRCQNRDKWDFPLDDTWSDDIVFGEKNTRYKSVDKGKEFWFVQLGDTHSDYSWCKKDGVCHFKNVAKKFCTIVATECEKYSEYYEMMQKDPDFSPIDYTKNKIFPVAFEDFEKHFRKHHKRSFNFCVMEDGRLDNRIIFYSYRDDRYYYEKLLPTIGYSGWGGGYKAKYIDININSIESIKMAYEWFRPVYGEQYLENGKLYRRRGYYGTEE